MPTWRDDKILELASQLTYSPAEKRREQMDAAIELLPAIDASKTYPWDFVHFRITSFQPRTHIDHIVPGKILRADLATLIEFLSDTLSILAEDAAASGDSVMLLEEVTKKFNVSSKTIQRWRKQGLIALRYVYPDGRRRLGFLESMISQFATDNRERVERSATFKQLSDEEKSQIVALARSLAAQSRATIKEISRHIAHTLGRAPETIRYTLRRYDREHPEAAIFPDPAEIAHTPAAPLFAEIERDEIVQSFDAGTPLDDIAKRYGGTRTGIYRIVTRERAQKLKNATIEFMANPLFDHPEADNIILTVLPAEALRKAQASVLSGTNAKTADVYMARIPQDLPAFLQDIFRQPVMPQELETDAFRRMNFFKFKAARLQNALEVETAKLGDLAALESLLLQAGEIKNQILHSNLRVAVHVARKHQRADRPLAELVSDANIWLMRAVEKYDFARPARFSTYASYAIMKNFARDRAEQLTRRDTHMVTGQEEVLNAIDSRESAQAVPDQIDAAHLHSDLHSVIAQLNEREKELLTHHYGLNNTAPAMSLSQIGDKMGITKARVRQLEGRALRKLRLLLETRREKLHNATTLNPPARRVPGDGVGGAAP